MNEQNLIQREPTKDRLLFSLCKYEVKTWRNLIWALMILFFLLTSHFKILKTFTSSSNQYQSKLSFSHRESVHLSSFMNVSVIALWCPLEVCSAGTPVIWLYGSWWFPSVLFPSFLLLLNQHILLPWSPPVQKLSWGGFFCMWDATQTP